MERVWSVCVFVRLCPCVSVLVVCHFGSLEKDIICLKQQSNWLWLKAALWIWFSQFCQMILVLVLDIELQKDHDRFHKVTTELQVLKFFRWSFKIQSITSHCCSGPSSEKQYLLFPELSSTFVNDILWCIYQWKYPTLAPLLCPFIPNAEREIVVHKLSGTLIFFFNLWFCFLACYIYFRLFSVIHYLRPFFFSSKLFFFLCLSCPL